MKIKDTLKKILGLFVSTESYNYFLKKGWVQVLAVFALFQLTSGLIFGTRLLVNTIPLFIDTTEQTLIASIEQIPEDTTFSWQDNQLSVTSSAEEINIEIPAEVKTVSNQLPKYLLMYSDQTLTNELLDEQYNTSFFVLDPTTLHFREETGIWRSFNLKEIEGFDGNFSISRNEIKALATEGLTQTRQALSTHWYLVLLVAPSLLAIASLAKLIIDGILLFILVQLNSYKLSFSKTAQLTLLIGGVATLIGQVGTTLYPQQSIPFFSVTFWLIAIYIFLVNRKRIG